MPDFGFYEKQKAQGKEADMYARPVLTDAFYGGSEPRVMSNCTAEPVEIALCRFT